MERSKKLSQKLLRDRDPGSGGARNPHVLPCTLRFLRSVLTRLTAARDVFETASKAILIMVLAVAGLSAAQAGTLYKWVDSQGRVSYHDQPPPEGSGYRVEEKNLGSDKKPAVDDALEKIVEKYPVILYSVPVCGSCDLARVYLQKRKVPFTEQNLENNGELQQKLKNKIGSLSAPIIMIGEKVMKGYVESILEGELDSAGYPKIEASESAKEEGKDKENISTTGDPGYRPARRRY